MISTPLLSPGREGDGWREWENIDAKNAKDLGLEQIDWV